MTKPIKIRTTSGERGICLVDASGNPLRSSVWYHVRLNGGVERQQHAATLVPKDKSKRRNATLEASKDAALTDECHRFLAQNPQAWRSDHERS